MITRVKAINCALTITVAGQTLRAKSYEVRRDGSRRVILTEGNCVSEQAVIIPESTDFACLPGLLTQVEGGCGETGELLKATI